MLNLPFRPRRLRQNHSIRNLVQETHVTAHDLVYPIFVQEHQPTSEIQTMPGIYRTHIDDILRVCDECVSLGINAIALFPGIAETLKNSLATEALNEQGLVPKTIKKIKHAHPELLIITDIALDPYSTDGHDGLVKNGQIMNDETVAVLKEMACLHASGGADIVAPSDMMDGRVGEIRSALDQSNYIDTMILAYTAKYASAFYGPFRDALQSAPKNGDKKSYQLNFSNRFEAIQEALLDSSESADMIMVKPATCYLDIVNKLTETVTQPVAAYHVSGEYAMLKAAQKEEMFDYESALSEVLHSIKRAGARFILSYGALDYLKQTQI